MFSLKEGLERYEAQMRLQASSQTTEDKGAGKFPVQLKDGGVHKQKPTKAKASNVYKILAKEDFGSEFLTISFENPQCHVGMPGQYLIVYPSSSLPKAAQKPLYLAVASGRFETSLKVTFPKSSYPGTQKYRLGHKDAGDNVQIEGPMGSGLPLDSPHPLLVLGAGSTISVIRSIMCSTPDTKKVELVYSTKRRSTLPYPEEIQSWMMQGKAHVSLTQEESDGFHHGRVNTHIVEKPVSEETRVFITGPDGFIKDMLEILLSKGVEDHKIYVSLNRPPKGKGPVCCFRDVKEHIPGFESPPRESLSL